MVTNDHRVGLLVVRTWRDEDRFRARLSFTVDVESETPTVKVRSDVDQIRSMVLAWLDQVSPQPPDEQSPDGEPA